MKTRIEAFLLALLLALLPLVSASALQATTLCNGMSGEAVKEIQQALIDLGYLKGEADGVFGNKTENAVRNFQKANGLTADGLVGEQTRTLLLKMAAELHQQNTDSTPTPQPETEATPTPTPSPEPVATATPAPTGSSLFGGNYATIRYGDKGARVKALQTGLITLKYLKGTADGKFGKQTKTAVISFQKAKGLTADGVAGKKTLKALESALQGNSSPTPTPAADEDLNDRITPPSVSSLKLLAWFDDVKPSISNGQKLLVYEPGSGLSWTVRVLARGRHCDAEPLTKKDTRTLIAAFDGKTTWNQKGVYVQLPDGRWTVGTTHDVAHSSNTISGNDFNGHLCIHFLRTMEECKKNDPNYGVSNQETLRAFWKSLTGNEINY